MATNVIAVAPETSLRVFAGGFDQAKGNAARGEEVRDKRTSSNNNQHLTPQGEIAENNCSTSVLQRSGNTVTHPLQLDHSSSEPAPDQLCPGGSTLPPQHPHLPPALANSSLKGPAPDDPSPENNAVFPRYLQLPSVVENSSLDKPALDDLSPEKNPPQRPHDFQMAARAGNNSLVEPAPGDLSSEENPQRPQAHQMAAFAGINSLVGPVPVDLSLRENPLLSEDLQLAVLPRNDSFIEPAPSEVSQGENPLPPQDPQLAALAGNNNFNEPAAPNEIHPAENLAPPAVELDVIAEQGSGIISSLGQVDGEHLDEQPDSLSVVSGPNEDVHQPRNADQPDVRPNLLTQNSCYEQPRDFRDEEGKLSQTCLPVYYCSNAGYHSP